MSQVEVGPAVERLEDMLFELEVGPHQLRCDPTGRQWLPAEARALVESSAQCRAAFEAFVRDELQLAAMGSSDAPAVDPFFTARVVGSLPDSPSGTGLSPRRRAMVLGAFHVIAVVLTYVVLTMVPESTARWAAQAHTVLSWGSDGVGSLALMLTGAGAALVVAFFASRIHTPA